MNRVVEVGRKSWVASLKSVSKHGLCLLLALALAVEQSMGWLIVAAAVGASAAYHLAVLRSWRLMATQEGIVLSWGLLPWTKRLESIIWADVGDLRCRNGWWSWLSRSHEVTVLHRFTLETVIRFTDMQTGMAAAQDLMRMRQQSLEGGARPMMMVRSA